jgi:hypothetical protein
MADEQQEEKQELIKAAKQLPPTETFSLRPRTFDEAYRFANLIADSDMIPKEFQKKPANVLVAVQLGMELGVSPMQALQSMYVVNGRPSIFGDLLPAIVFASGLCEQFDEQGDTTTASCTVKRKGSPPITRTFTWEDAKRAKGFEHGQVISLAEKSTYKSYPQRMLQMRARSWAIRDAFPDVLKGVAVYEEAQDEAASIEIEKEPPIGIPQPKAKPETVEQFMARQAEKAVPNKGKKDEPAKSKPTDGPGAAKVVDQAVSPQPSDGIQPGPDQGDAPEAGTPARESAPADGKSQQEKEPQEPQAPQAGSLAKAQQEQVQRDRKEEIVAKSEDFKADILEWISNATTEELNSKEKGEDGKFVCWVREIFGDKKLLGKLTNEDRAKVLLAYDAEVKKRP